jgi:antitoxin ParD1/3/4
MFVIMPRMNVSLTQELEGYINKKVATGDYQSASEVVREALRLMRQRDAQLARLRRDVQIGLEQIENGLAVPFDVERIKAAGRRRLTAAKGKKRVG